MYLVPLQTFILYPELEEKPLNVGKALSTLALFNILTLPMALFTYFCTTFITANVSIKRLMHYLLAEDTEGLADKNKTLTHSIGIDTTDVGESTGTEVGWVLTILYKGKHSPPFLFWPLLPTWSMGKLNLGNFLFLKWNTTILDKIIWRCKRAKKTHHYSVLSVLCTSE